MNINNFDLEYKKKIALAHLAAGKTLKVAAEKSGLTQPTISKLRDSPTGQKLIRQAVVQIYDASVAELSLGCMEAVTELRQIINDSEVSAKVKITAINTLLQFAAKAKDALIEERLENIEGLLDEREIQAKTI